MNKFFTILAICFIAQTQAQIVINEVASTNLNIYTDEDGDYSDWIELYNSGASPINISGYALADSKSPIGKWVFSDSIIPAFGRIIAYASGKDRNCSTCPTSPIDHWETAIFEDDIWEYKNGTTEPPANWNDVSFTGVWSTGPGGFGTGDGDDNTIIGGFSSSFYYRKEFEIVDKSKIIKTIISMDYDDAYVIYINDVEVARININGTPTHSTYASYWHEALMYLGLRPKTIELDSALVASLLVNGTNVLAVEIHQYGTDDATGRTWLHFGISTPDIYFYDNPEWFSNPGTATQFHTNFKIANGENIYLYNPAGTLVDSVLVDDLHVNHVRARLPDGGSWCYSDEPTPATANTGTCYSGYAEEPVITTAAGFYVGSVNVSITGSTVYYTTDGSNPDVTASTYTGPIPYTSTGVLKAMQTEVGKLPSRVVTGSYFINEPTTLPVVSIIANPCDLFNEGPDCIAAYDGADGWFNHNPKVSVAVEYFDADKVKQFGDNYKFECVGNYSISLPQKSMRFVNDEDYGSLGDIAYPLFEHDKPGMEFVHGFRVRNADQDYYGTRMKDITINRIGLPTHSISTGYQNCAVFINGEYWGMYGAREEMDEYFLRDNFGVNPDEVDMIKTGWGGEEKTIAEAGSDTAYYALIDLILNNDMTDPDIYAQVIEEIDVENWVDYIATEVFTDQEEWLQMLENNIRLFRSYSPDIKWRYILWDCTNSQFSSNANTLQGSLSNPNNSVYADMFNALLDNPTYKNYFINRFADLINYYFTLENNNAIIDELKAEMEPEIPAQNSRWGSGNTVAWNNSVNSVYNFYANRNTNQRNHIKTYFGLAGQVNVTLAVNPPGAGYVKISTIVPENLPWTGVYFNGNPVTVTAIPNPGYTFVDWDDNPFIDDPSSISFNKNITAATTFTANFTGSSIANPIVISEINYNSDATLNGGDWLELYNYSATAVDVSSYHLKEKYYYSDFTIPNGTVIPAYGYLVLAEDKQLFNSIYPSVTNVVGDFHFTLKNDSDIIAITNFIGDTLQWFHYYDNRPWPFTADGYGRTMESKGALLDPALPTSWFEGCMGGSPGEAYFACFENPLVDEINYNSAPFADAGDWFEIYNYGIDDLDMSNWRLKDKNDNSYMIPDGTILAGGEYIVFYSDATKFNTRFPAITNKVGPINFNYDGNGDVIVIYDADGKIYQSVGFDDSSPYPLAPDGGGTALQIVDVMMNINFGTNWMSSCPEGTPGSAFVTPCNESIDDLANALNLAIYPNPADNFISVNFPENWGGNYAVTIYDISSKIVLEKYNQSINQHIISVADLQPGIYQIKAIYNQQTYSGSFVKN